MGIDAKILIRGIPRSTVTDEWLKEQSWRLVSSIGAKHFYINDGLPPEQHDEAMRAWLAAFKAHPLNADYEASRKDGGMFNLNEETRKKTEALREHIVKDIGESPGTARHLAIEPTNTHYREPDEPPPGAVYYQDGPEIKAFADECLLTVNVATRYYGVGYERGDILTLCAIAECLEVMLPGCQVWYGGDSSGVCAEPFGEIARRAHRQHLYSEEGRDYFNEWPSMRTDNIQPPAPCGMCPGGEYRGARFGFGKDYASYHCRGCGKSVATRDGGKTWAPEKED